MPQRIVSLLASATEILYDLGLGDRVVAVSHECDRPADVANKPRVTSSRIDDKLSSMAIDEQVHDLMSTAQPLYEIDAATITKLRPDLIVTQSQCDVCAVRHADVVKLVQSTPQLAQTQIVALNPWSLEDVLNDIRRVGEAAGVTDRAESLVSTLRNRIQHIQSITRDLAEHERPRTVCIEWIEPLMIAANWMPELIQIAGGRCNLTEAGAHSAYSSWADVVDYDPQAIVVAPCGFNLARTISDAGVLPALDDWHRLTAVRENRVWAADGNAYFNRSSPMLVDTIELLAGLLHPTAFPSLRQTHRADWCKLPA